MELNDVKDRKPTGADPQLLKFWPAARGGRESSLTATQTREYRLYKQRWVGLFGLSLLNVIAGLNWVWFSAIAINTSKEFGISLGKVNWLGNTISLVYLPVSLLVPVVCSRWGLQVSFAVGSVAFLLASWVRFAGTASSLSPDGKYALLLIGQILSGFGQPWFQILGPKYSEVWFDLRGRTTATMIIAIANPIGAALAQFISPMFPTVRESILILAIITTVAAPFVYLIHPLPPTPPTFAGSRPSPPAEQILRACIGKARLGEAVMSLRERIDLALITLAFGVLVGVFDAFSLLINQIFAPHGYSADASGIFGGVLILTGIIGAAIMSPVFDRYLTRHLALACKILVPTLACCNIGLTWAVRPNNEAGIYVLMVIMGVTSFTLLPVALEMGCEITRSAETSSAILWFAGNLLTVVFVPVMDALRDDSPTARPPGHMRKALIFQACVVAVPAIAILALNGQQTRREMDVQKLIDSPEGEI